MEKTCAAEKNRTTDTMWVEKKKGGKKERGKKGEVLSTERSPMMCQKEHDKEEMGRPIKRQFLDFNYHQPHTVTSGHWLIFIFYFLNDQKETLERKKVK